MTNKVKGLLSTTALLLAVCMLALGFAACSGSNRDSAHAEAMGSDVPTEEPVTDIPTEAPVTDVPTEEPATEEPTDAPITDGATPEKTPLPDGIKIVGVIGPTADVGPCAYKHYCIRAELIDLFTYYEDLDFDNMLFEVVLSTRRGSDYEVKTEAEMMQAKEELSEELSQDAKELNALGYNLKYNVYWEPNNRNIYTIFGCLYGYLTREQILNIPEPYKYEVDMLRDFASGYGIPLDEFELVEGPVLFEHAEDPTPGVESEE